MSSQALEQLLEQQRQLLQLNYQLCEQHRQLDPKQIEEEIEVGHGEVPAFGEQLGEPGLRSGGKAVAPGEEAPELLTLSDIQAGQQPAADESREAGKPQSRGLKRSRSTTIKKIVKRKTFSVSALPQANVQDEKSPAGAGQASRKRSPHTLYEVKTIRIDKAGRRSEKSSMSMDKQPQEVRDLSNSMQMLQSIKQNSKRQLRKYHRSQQDLKLDPYKAENARGSAGGNHEVDESSEDAKQFARMPGGLLSNIMNPKNVASVLTIDTGPFDRNRKVYVQTVAGLTRSSSHKKKITVIQKKKRRDGSSEKQKQIIYKDYGDAFARRESRRLGSALECYSGSAKALQRVVRSGNSITILPNGQFQIQRRAGQQTNRNGDLVKARQRSGSSSAGTLVAKKDHVDDKGAQLRQQTASQGALAKNETRPTVAWQEQQTKGVKMQGKRAAAADSDLKSENPYGQLQPAPADRQQ